jgi:MYXO-CTERM domain-containing protein
MKSSTKFVLSMGVLALMAAEAATAGFTPYVIRNSDGGNAPSITTSGANTIFGVPSALQKAGYGSNDVNGMTISQLSSMQFTLNSATPVGNTTPLTAILPYVNIWVQDAVSSNYFVINFGLDAFVTTTGGVRSVNVGYNDMVLAGAFVRVSENNNANLGLATGGWLATALGAPGANGGNGYTMAQVANFKIVAPPSSWVAFPNNNGVGAAAPRELGTNTTFGFNWIFGQGNGVNNGYNGYDYTVSGVSVPAPGALALLGVAGLVVGRRRRA